MEQCEGRRCRHLAVEAVRREEVGQSVCDVVLSWKDTANWRRDS